MIRWNHDHRSSGRWHPRPDELDAAIPVRTDTNLLVATWNIRAFGDLTTEWTARPGDSPKRDWHAVACIAALISRFGVIAL